jgi:hypothetical protein
MTGNHPQRLTTNLLLRSREMGKEPYHLARGRQKAESPQDQLERLTRPTESGCWEWLGKIRKDGYADMSYRLGPQNRVTRKVATVAWELKNAREVPPGLVLDHLCRNPWCVNPDHLEAVTQKENWDRGDGPNSIKGRKRFFCDACGNAYELFSTARASEEWGCRTCRAERAKKWREKTGYDFNQYRAENKDRINANRRARRAQARREGRKVT